MQVAYPTVVLFGPPGAGKGTVGRVLGDSLDDLYYVGIGDVVRKYQKIEPYKSIIEEHISKGELVPDAVMVEIFSKYLDNEAAAGKLREHHTVLLDGGARRPSQVDLFSKVIDVKALFHFTNVSDELLLQRLLKRAEQDKARGKLRTDDHSEAIRNRIKRYPLDTYPVIEEYKKRGARVIDINANGHKDVVAKELIAKASVFLQSK